MKKLRLNSFTFMFVAFSTLLFVFFALHDDKIETYEHITIEHGDTLWSLAETYRGKMEKHDWINFVKKENGLRDETVVRGQVLVVPVARHSEYIANLQQEHSSENNIVKVARNND